MRGALAVMAVIVSAVVATSHVAAAAAQDRVTGQGAASGSFGAKVSARSGPEGESPRGSFSVEDAGGQKTQVKITCMFEAGNTAVVGGVDADGFERFVKVQDNGSAGDRATVGSGAVVTPDRLRCEEIFAALPALLPISGDFTVDHA
jgi:hypothetical protein